MFGYAAKMQSESSVHCDFCVSEVDNQAIAFCCECREFLCAGCSDTHKRARRFLQHTVVAFDKESASLLPSVVQRGAYICTEPDHSENRVKFYCEACRCLVCQECTVANHKDHKCVDVVTTANVQREEMREAVRCASEALAKLDHAMDGNKAVVQNVYATKCNCETVINRSFEALREALEQRRTALLSELADICLSKTAALTLQGEHFEKTKQNIVRYVEAISHILQTHSDHEVLSLGGQVPNELKQVLSHVEMLPLTPNLQNSITASVRNTHIIEVLEIGTCN